MSKPRCTCSHRRRDHKLMDGVRSGRCSGFIASSGVHERCACRAFTAPEWESGPAPPVTYPPAPVDDELMAMIAKLGCRLGANRQINHALRREQHRARMWGRHDILALVEALPSPLSVTPDPAGDDLQDTVACAWCGVSLARQEFQHRDGCLWPRARAYRVKGSEDY